MPGPQPSATLLTKLSALPIGAGMTVAIPGAAAPGIALPPAVRAAAAALQPPGPEESDTGWLASSLPARFLATRRTIRAAATATTHAP